VVFKTEINRLRGCFEKLFPDYKKTIQTNVILKRFFGLFSIDILTKASGFILLPIYLKLMTQEQFGMFGYVLSLISNIAMVLNLGLYVAQSKLFHDYQERKKNNLLSL